MIKILALFFLTPLLFLGPANATNGVSLDDVKTLTLYSNRMTEARRGYAIAQMSCVGGDACGYSKYRPNTVQCYNMGSDGVETQWSCDAVLHPNVRFGDLTVNCEGYLSPMDKNVLIGSCGLEYSLEYTDVHKTTGRNTIGGFVIILCIALSPLLCAMGTSYGGSSSSSLGSSTRFRGRRYLRVSRAGLGRKA
jgi:hypothetical protein